MNSHLYTNAHGLRLITQFEGAPRLKARLCEGGAWELGYGVTFDLNGNPFQEGDTCTDDQALAYFRNALGIFEDAVRESVTVPLNSNQFSALVALCYNIGVKAFRGSSVLRHVNASRFDDAADAFGMWLYATKGQHKQALRGLLRRRYAEACLFMSYDWEEACGDEAVALVRQRPPNNIGTDKVLSKTLFKDVLAVAQHYPLPPIDEPPVILQESLPGVPTKPLDLKPLNEAEEIPSAPLDELVLDTPALARAPGDAADRPDSAPVTGPVASAPKSSPASVELSGPGGSGQAAPSSPPASKAPPVPTPPPVVAKPPPPPVVIAPKQIDIRSIPYGEMGDNPPAKNMSDSTRVIGMVIVGIGSIVQILAGREIISSTIGAVFFDMSRDPVLVALGAGAVVMVFGWLTRKRGTQIMAKGMSQATTVLK